MPARKKPKKGKGKPKAKAKKPKPKPARVAGASDQQKEIRQLRNRCAELLQRLDHKEEQPGLVNGVMRTIIAGAPLFELLKVFASNLKAIVPYDRSSISLVDYEREVFHIPFKIMGSRVMETREDPRPFGTTVLTQVIDERRPMLRSNVKRDEVSYDSDENFLKAGFATEMIFPLMVGDKVFGTFQIGCFEAGRLTDDHLRLLMEVVPAIAVAVYQHFSDQKFIFV